jgi:hypothetical protein
MTEDKYRRILEKAKIKYTEAIKARDYQDNLYAQDKYQSHRMAIDDLVWKRQQYQIEINLLENIFGKDLKNI